MNFFNQFKIGQRLVASFVAVALMAAGMGIAALYFADKISEEGYDVGAHLAPLANATMEIQLSATTAHLVFEEIMSGDDSESIDEVWTLLDETTFFAKTIAEGGESEEGSFLPSENPEVIAKAKEITEGIEKFLVAAHARYDGRASGGGAGSAIEIAFDEEFDVFMETAHELEKKLHQNMEEGLLELNENRSFVTTLILVIVLLVFVVAITLGIVISRSVSRPIAEAVGIAKNISQGNFDNKIVNSRQDEVGDMFTALEQMQSVLFVQITNEKNEAERIKVAMDQLSGNVMMGDTDYNIIYMNDAVTDFMRASVTEFRKALPNFNPDTLMGTCIDIFHKDPSHQRRLLDGLTSTYTSGDLPMGDMTVQVIASPVVSETGERLGTVVEWVDRTNEVVVEKEVASIIGAAQSGDLSQRLNTADKEGFFEALSTGINTLVDVADQAINDTIKGLDALESGDLTYRITNDYEGAFDAIKQANNNTADRLAEVMGGIRSVAEEVASGSSEIMDGNTTLSDRTQEQAAALEETAASVEEMTSTVQQNADNSRQANQLAVSAREQAEDGGKVVARAVEAMSGITASSTKISDIISVIDEIAFQTNLLALNAAVEAARAGDAGRGFAVVAGEVRTLAGRSAEAAKEIKELINASVESVQAGSKLVDESGGALNEIVGSVQKVGDIIAEIAAASQEQASGIQQINTAITSMDSAVQQNAALVEETTAASESLNDQAGGMSKMVGTFNLGDSPTAPKRVAKKNIVAKKTTAKRPAVKKAKAAPKSKAPAPDSDDEWAEF
ncbi:MAG: methyl-accepting chemotaxis protein [Mariprofundaceae bacterium]